MITCEPRGKIHRIWDVLWSGRISNPLEVIETITHLLFVSQLAEARASSPQP